MVLLMIVACAGSNVYAQRNSDQILAEIRQIQAQLAELQSSQLSIEQTVKLLAEKSDSRESGVLKIFADSTTVLKRVHEDLSILSSRVDETNGRLSNVRREITSLRQSQEALVLSLPNKEELAAEATATTSEGGDTELISPTVIATGPTLTDLYQQARLDYTQGRFVLAISGFEEVIQDDPGGDLADNAYYWIGESFVAQQQYERGIEAFDTVIRDYADSNKVPDAYFKKATTLEALNQITAAMKLYELIIKHFPRTQVERMSQGKLEHLVRTLPPEAPRDRR